MREGSSAAAVGVVVPPQFFGFLRRPSTFVDAPDAGTPRPDTPILYLTAEAAGKLFAGSLDGLAPGATGATASLDLIVHVEPVPNPARNVVAILPGSDPKLRGEYVAIGAHNDHIGMNQRPVDHDSLRLYNHLVRPGGAEDSRAQATPEQQQEINRQLAAWRAAHPGTEREDSISNGADDDGSGSVSVLEMAQHLASLKRAPRRSILFVWHVGEELGMLGSGYFTDYPTVPRDSIVAQLNIDMVGRGDAWDVTGESKDGQTLHGNPNYLQIVGSRRLSTELGDLIEQVNRADKHGLVFDYSMDANGHPMNIYCRSDHYSYARYGIPVAFFTTGGHSDYHQVTDEPQYIDYDHMARVDRLIEDVAIHVANLDHRVVVDHPRPDPHGSCQQ
ncbi:MAG TPA: M28 family peptidase, partial [Gemmatimonadales bacterium]|nr:M28 family peptidase [Gemmatimonadales bacterium]